MRKVPSRRLKQRFELANNIVVNEDLSSINMSETGMLLECPKLHSVGKKLKVELYLSGSSINTICTVRWSKLNPSAFSDQFLCGVEFTELKASELLLVRQFLEQFEDDEVKA